jgi:hypothetical protein
MAMQSATIDGVAASWADSEVEITINNGATVKLEDVQSFNASNVVEVGVLRRADGTIRNTTKGPASPEASMTLTHDEWRKLRTALAAVNPERYSLTKFNTVILWSPPGGAIETLELVGVRALGPTRSNTQSVDPSMVEIGLSVEKLLEDGVSA